MKYTRHNTLALQLGTLEAWHLDSQTKGTDEPFARMETQALRTLVESSRLAYEATVLLRDLGARAREVASAIDARGLSPEADFTSFNEPTFQTQLCALVMQAAAKMQSARHGSLWAEQQLQLLATMRQAADPAADVDEFYEELRAKAVQVKR